MRWFESWRLIDIIVVDLGQKNERLDTRFCSFTTAWSRFSKEKTNFLGYFDWSRSLTWNKVLKRLRDSFVTSLIQRIKDQSAHNGSETSLSQIFRPREPLTTLPKPPELLTCYISSTLYSTVSFLSHNFDDEFFENITKCFRVHEWCKSIH